MSQQLIRAGSKETLVRLRSAKPLVDFREFGEVVPLIEPTASSAFPAR